MRHTFAHTGCRLPVIVGTAVLSALTVMVGSTTAQAAVPTVDAPAPPAYVLHTNATTMTVLDTAQRTVTGSAPAGPAATRMALSPDGSRGYVTSSSSDTVTVVDLATSTELAQFATGDAPGQVAVSADGARLFVLLDSGVLQALDTTTGSEVGRVSLGSNDGSTGMAMHPDGRHLYVAAGSLVEVDTTSLTVARSIAVTEGTGAHGVVLSPGGGTAYVASSYVFEGGIDVVDLASGAVTDRVGLGSIPGPLAVTPDGRQLYVAIAATFVNTGYGAGFLPGRSIAVVDTATAQRISSIDLGAAGSAWTLQNTAAGLAVSADGTAVVASVPRLSAVLVADRTTGVVEDSIATAARPGQVVVPAPPPAPTVDAVRDQTRRPATATGTAVPDVRANDSVNGGSATLATTRLRQLSSTSADLTLDPTDGSVDLLRPTAPGTAAVTYRLCTIAPVRVCDRARAVVRLTG